MLLLRKSTQTHTNTHLYKIFWFSFRYLCLFKEEKLFLVVERFSFHSAIVRPIRFIKLLSSYSPSIYTHQLICRWLIQSILEISIASSNTILILSFSFFRWISFRPVSSLSIIVTLLSNNRTDCLDSNNKIIEQWHTHTHTKKKINK